MEVDIEALATEEYGPNHPVTIGRLRAILATLAERVDEFGDNGEFAQEYVDQLKERGIIQ